MRQAFNKAVIWGRFQGSNPIKGVKLPKLDNKKERVLSDEEEHVLLDALKMRSIDMHDMAVVALYAGFRFGEISQLKRRDVDFKNGLITVDGKGGKRRTVPMNERTRAVLENRVMSGSESDELLFPDRSGKVRKYPHQNVLRNDSVIGTKPNQR